MAEPRVIEVRVPPLGEGAEGATLVAWLAPDRQMVQAGDPLAEVEHDKTSVILHADCTGHLTRLVAAGAELAAGTVIGHLGDAPGPGPQTPPPRPVSDAQVDITEPGDSTAPTHWAGTPLDGGASPLARRLAARLDVDLGTVTGTGPGGLITRGDVHGAAGISMPRPAPAPVGPLQDTRGQVERPELGPLQRAVARRMEQSHRTIPAFAVHLEIDAEPMLRLRQRLRQAAGPSAVPSINDLVVKASAQALREHPAANAAIRDGVLERYERVNIAMAVAVTDGLRVPVIHDADRLTLGELARTSRDLAARARDGALDPTQSEGATFTVTNLGTRGVHDCLPLISPPQVAILGAGAVRTAAVVRDGQPAVGRVMSLTMCADHRVLNGADGADLLTAIGGRLVEPLQLAL